MHSEWVFVWWSKHLARITHNVGRNLIFFAISVNRDKRTCRCWGGSSFIGLFARSSGVKRWLLIFWGRCSSFGVKYLWIAPVTGCEESTRLPSRQRTRVIQGEGPSWQRRAWSDVSVQHLCGVSEITSPLSLTVEVVHQCARVLLQDGSSCGYRAETLTFNWAHSFWMTFVMFWL